MNAAHRPPEATRPGAFAEVCLSGEFAECRNQEFTSVHHDGGYPEVMIAKASSLVHMVLRHA